MPQNLASRPVFSPAGRKNAKIRLSLIGLVLGIFLLPQTAYLAAVTPEKLIELTNSERAASGLNVLSVNPRLNQAALAKGQAILAAQTFSHTLGEKKFSAWIRETGYEYSYVGENLAIDFLTSEGVIAAWNDSAAHRQNLLSPYYKEIGLAAVAGEFEGQPTTVVVQIFGAPAAAPVKTENFTLAPAQAKPLKSLIDLTPAVFGRADNRLTAPPSNLPAPTAVDQLNKFVVQPLAYSSFDDTLLAMMIFSLSYLAIFLFFGRLYKPGRLSAS